MIAVGRIKLSGNALKMIALVTMTIDHIGVILLHESVWFRGIGRLSFPLFGYMLAEGCAYTTNRRKHIASIFRLGMLCQIVLFLVERSLYQGILMTFCLSILTIYAIQFVTQSPQGSGWRFLVVPGILTVDVFFCVALPKLLSGTDYAIDYGLCGVLFPVFVFLGKNRWQKWFLAAAGLAFVARSIGGLQWCAFFSLPFLFCYSGEKGTWKMKNVFYVYYPIHFVVLYLIGYCSGMLS